MRLSTIGQRLPAIKRELDVRFGRVARTSFTDRRSFPEVEFKREDPTDTEWYKSQMTGEMK